MSTEYDKKFAELQSYLPDLNQLIEEARNRKDPQLKNLEKLRDIVTGKIKVSVDILGKTQLAIKKRIQKKTKSKKTEASSVTPNKQVTDSNSTSDIKIKTEFPSKSDIKSEVLDNGDDDDIQIVEDSCTSEAVIILDSDDEASDDANTKNTSSSAAVIDENASTNNNNANHIKSLQTTDASSSSSSKQAIKVEPDTAENTSLVCQRTETTRDACGGSSIIQDIKTEPNPLEGAPDLASSSKECQSESTTTAATATPVQPPQLTFDPNKVHESRDILKQLESQLKQLSHECPLSIDAPRAEVDPKWTDVLLKSLKGIFATETGALEAPKAIEPSKSAETISESKCDNNEPIRSNIGLPFPFPVFTNNSNKELMIESNSTTSTPTKSDDNAGKSNNVSATTDTSRKESYEAALTSTESEHSHQSANISSHAYSESQNSNLTAKANTRLAGIIASLQNSLVAAETQKNEKSVAKEAEPLFINKLQLTEIPSIVDDMLSTRNTPDTAGNDDSLDREIDETVADLSSTVDDIDLDNEFAANLDKSTKVCYESAKSDGKKSDDLTKDIQCEKSVPGQTKIPNETIGPSEKVKELQASSDKAINETNSSSANKDENKLPTQLSKSLRDNMLHYSNDSLLGELHLRVEDSEEEEVDPFVCVSAITQGELIPSEGALQTDAKCTQPAAEISKQCTTAGETAKNTTVELKITAETSSPSVSSTPQQLPILSEPSNISEDGKSHLQTVESHVKVDDLSKECTKLAHEKQSNSPSKGDAVAQSDSHNLDKQQPKASLDPSTESPVTTAAIGISKSAPLVDSAEISTAATKESNVHIAKSKTPLSDQLKENKETKPLAEMKTQLISSNTSDLEDLSSDSQIFSKTSSLSNSPNGDNCQRKKKLKRRKKVFANSEASTSKSATEANAKAEIESTKSSDDPEFLKLQIKKLELERQLMLLKSKSAISSDQPSKKDKHENLSEISAESDAVSLSYSDLSDVEPGEIVDDAPMKTELDELVGDRSPLQVTIVRTDIPDLRHTLNARARQESRQADLNQSLRISPKSLTPKKKKRKRHRQDAVESRTLVKSELPDAVHSRPSDVATKRIVNIGVKVEFPNDDVTNVKREIVLSKSPEEKSAGQITSQRSYSPGGGEATTSHRDYQPRRRSRSPANLIKVTKRSPDHQLSRSPKRSPDRRLLRSPVRLLKISKHSPDRLPRRSPPRRRSRSPRRLSRSPPKRLARKLSRSPRRSPRRLSRSPRRSPRRLSRSPRRSPRRMSRSPKRSPRRSPIRRSRSPKRINRRSSRSPRRSPRRLSRSPRRSPRRRSPRRVSRSPRRLSRSPRRLSRSPRRLSRSPRRLSRSPRRRSRSPRRLSPRRLSRSPRRLSLSPRRLSRSPRRLSRSPRRLSRSPRRSSRSPRRRSRSPKRRYSTSTSNSPRRLREPSQQSVVKIENPKSSPPKPSQSSIHKPVTNQPITVIDLSDSDDNDNAATVPVSTNDSNSNKNIPIEKVDEFTIEVSDDEENFLDPPPPPIITAEDIKLSPKKDASDSDGDIIFLDVDDEPLPRTLQKKNEADIVPPISDNSVDTYAEPLVPTPIESLHDKNLEELHDIKVQIADTLGVNADVLSQLFKKAFDKISGPSMPEDEVPSIPESQIEPPMLILSAEKLNAPVTAYVSPKDPRLNRNRVQPSNPVLVPSSDPPPAPTIPRLTPAVALPESSPKHHSVISSDDYSDEDYSSGSSRGASPKTVEPDAEYITMEVSKLQEIIDKQIEKYLAQNKLQLEASSTKTAAKKTKTISKPLKNACSKDGSGPRHMTAEKIVSDIRSMASGHGTSTPSTSNAASLPAETPKRKRSRSRKRRVITSSTSESDDDIPIASPISLPDVEGVTNVVEVASERSETPSTRRGRGRPRKQSVVESSPDGADDNNRTASPPAREPDSLRSRLIEDLTDIIKLGKADKSAKVKPTPALKQLAEQPTNLLTPLKEIPFQEKQKKTTEAGQSKKSKRIPKNIDKSFNCKTDSANCLLCRDKSQGLELISHYVNDHRETEVFTARLDTEQVETLKTSPNLMSLSKKSSNTEKYTGKCPICEEVMTCTIGRLMEHFASHTGEYAYECDCCGLRDPRKRDILKHSQNECEKGAKFIYVYRYDLSEKVIEAFVCGICNYIQLNRANVIKHLRTEHEVQLLSSEDFFKVTLFQVGDEPSAEAATEPVEDNIEVLDEALANDYDDNYYEEIADIAMSDTASQGNDIVESVKNELLQDVIDDSEWKAIFDTVEDTEKSSDYPLKSEVTVEEGKIDEDEKLAPKSIPEMTSQIFTEIHLNLNDSDIKDKIKDPVAPTKINAAERKRESEHKKMKQIKAIVNLLKVENIGIEEISPNTRKFHCLIRSCSSEGFENLDDLRKHIRNHSIKWSGFCHACKKKVFKKVRMDTELKHLVDKHLTPKSLTTELLCPWLDKVSRPSNKSEDVCKMLLTNYTLENLYKCMGVNCVFTSNSSSDMEMHLNTSHASDPTALNCCYCKENFWNCAGLVSHIAKVHASSNYQCSKCFYRSCAAYNVQMHQRTYHKNVKDLSIIGCDLAVRPNHSFTTDILEILDYRLKNVQPIKCPFFTACRKNMYTKYLVLDHIKRVHSQKEAVDMVSPTYDCMYCAYGTDELLSIRQHMANEHADRLLYVCGRVFIKSLYSMIGQDDFDITSIKKTTCLVYIGGDVNKKRLRLTQEVTYASDSIQAVNMGGDTDALNARIRKWFGEAATNFEEIEAYIQRIVGGAQPDTMNDEKADELNDLVMAVIKSTGLVGKQLYKCGFPTCTRTFDRYEQFDAHMDSHKGDKKEPIYRCPHCSTIVATNQIRRHLLNHSRHRFLCFFCGESNPSQETAISHMKDEHQIQGTAFVYLTVDKESASTENESRRIFVAKPRKISNDGDVPDVMRDVLKKRLDASQNSCEPETVNKQERPESPIDCKQETIIPVFVALDTRLTCNLDDCPFVAKTENELFRHIVERHRVMQKGKYECPHCSYVMPPTLRLNINRICNHLKYHGRNIVLCNVCNYYHHTRSRVLEHMSMCHPFNFATCTVYTRNPDGTKMKLEILYNKNVRSPDDSYKCTLCDAILTECQDFFIHMKELHHLNVRFGCDTCNFFENSLQAVEDHAKLKHPEGGKIRVRSVFLPAGGKWVQNLSPFTLLVESGGPTESEKNEEASTSDQADLPQPPPLLNNDNVEASGNKRKFEECDSKEVKRRRKSKSSKRPNDDKPSDENRKKARRSPVTDIVQASNATPSTSESKGVEPKSVVHEEPTPAATVAEQEPPKPIVKLVPVEKLLRQDIQNGASPPPLAQFYQWHEQVRSEPSTSGPLPPQPTVDVFLICFYCNVRTDNLAALLIHVLQNHSNDSIHFTVARRLLCAYCHAIMPFNDMKAHYLDRHPDHTFAIRSALYQNICGECPTVFKDDCDIEEHFKAAHNNLYLQKIPSCSYLTQAVLNELLNIEPNPNSTAIVFKCPCCEGIFLQNGSCVKHITECHKEAVGQMPVRKVTKRLLYGCYPCRTLYETENRALHHMRKHAQPYGCKHCEMRFYCHDKLIDHYRLCHGTNEITYQMIHWNGEIEEMFMGMLVRFPNGLILAKSQLQNTDYGQREQLIEMIESREKVELQEFINRQARNELARNELESIARIKNEIIQEAALFQPSNGGSSLG